MSGPRTKRQFAGAASDPAQRQITSFFSASTGTSAPSSPTKTPLNGPVLPGPVQTNLLNVGMRVRKSVQEGYKTGAQYSAFKLWEDNTVPAVSTNTTTTNTTTGGGAMRELLPFSGIHKVGGLGIQPAVGEATTTTATTDNNFDDYMPGLTNSQDSIFSNSSVTSAVEATERVNNNAKKRFFVNDEEDQEWAGQQGSWQDMEISPRSFGPAGFENRKWAMPKGKKNREAVVGQENVGGGMVVDGNDFEEASFLERMDDE
ncbi:ribonucleotide reductase inhibitor-domain-containing protein [Triangularia verruculosa]|uniref:Ribonucleotide reductase inhibitor-domain-containing protein n=1 Tax=Triangularia verruculosa TaxID=2587418 RepID=A0AAN6XJT0_9PEZI|nr:ribonucleotide reductase inhibitor-domain-containing protein [Triangularia verruculosa]